MRAIKNALVGSTLVFALFTATAAFAQDGEAGTAGAPPPAEAAAPAGAATGYAQPGECGDAAACAQLGWDRYWSMDYAGSIAALEWACGQGNYRGCDGLTGSYVMVCETPGAITGALARAESECSAGNQNGCRNRALLMLQACGGVEFQYDAAAAQLQASCAAGQPMACLEHTQLTNGWDNAVMRSAFEAACAAGVPSACANLASRYEFGLNDDGINLGLALHFHARGCALGDNFECMAAENLRSMNPGLEPVAP